MVTNIIRLLRNGDEHKVERPIRSAQAVAALRAAAAKEPDPSMANPDYFAKDYVSSAYRIIVSLPHAVTRRLVEAIAPGSYCYVLARTKFIDHYFLIAINDDIHQFVILGAGYDSRALRFKEQLQSKKIFELDLPNTQTAKIVRMKKLGIKPSENTKYIPIDFSKESIEDALIENGFDPARKTFFVWEGVSYFLKENDVKQVLLFIAHKCATGSSIAFDYALQSFINGNHSTYGGKEIHRWLVKNREYLYFGMEKNRVTEFMKDLGLKLVCDIGEEEIKKLYLTKRDGKQIGQPLGHLRLGYFCS